jgi:RNase P subunit RPR2
MKTQPAGQEDIRANIWSGNDKLTVSCLRCNTALTDYRPTRFTFLPYGISRAHAMLVCPKCGHVEFLSKESPLLSQLEAIASDGGDDD